MKALNAIESCERSLSTEKHKLSTAIHTQLEALNKQRAIENEATIRLYKQQSENVALLKNRQTNIAEKHFEDTDIKYNIDTIKNQVDSFTARTDSIKKRLKERSKFFFYYNLRDGYISKSIISLLLVLIFIILAIRVVSWAVLYEWPLSARANMISSFWEYAYSIEKHYANTAIGYGIRNLREFFGQTNGYTGHINWAL